MIPNKAHKYLERLSSPLESEQTRLNLLAGLMNRLCQLLVINV